MAKMTNLESRKSKKYKKKDPVLLLMTLPFFILVLIFSYLPLWGWAIAFVNYMPGINILNSEFVGLQHFTRIFANTSEFWKVMRNTIVMSLLNIAVTPLPIVFAIMLSEVRSNIYRRVVQTISSFPNFISWIIVYSVFFALFSVDDGLINNLLLDLGWIKQPFDLLSNADLTWFVQTFAGLWKTAGYIAIIYLANIASIDQDLYSAASIDGADKFRQILHVTIPGIMPTYIAILILSVGYLLSSGFEQYYVFSNPLNRNMIEVLDTYTYRLGIVNLDFSLATAVGVFKTVVSVFLITVCNRISKLVTGTSFIL